MRLPADAVLLVIDAQQAGDGSRHGADDASEVETNIAALIAAWRAEGLPLAHVGRSRSETAASLALVVSPLDGEIVTVANATSAFVGSDLEARLDELGATTLVLCGALATHALEASAWHAADLGYQVFIVADACLAADTVDLRGQLWPAEDVRALALAHLKGETATIVDVATTLRAAASAKARQRRGEGRA
jgi:nicotinamidase-related amidase